MAASGRTKLILMKIKVYCEDGALTKEIKGLRDSEVIELVVFPFEVKSRKIERADNPSMLTVDNTFITCDDTRIKIENTDESEIFDKVAVIVGKNHFNDIRHIDTAYKERCQIFISPDKTDIVSKADDLERLTHIKFFYCRDIEKIRAAIDELRRD